MRMAPAQKIVFVGIRPDEDLLKCVFLFLCRVGGSIPVVFSYFSEFMPRLRRGAMISALATFWMAGNILAAGGKLQEIK